MMTHREDNDIIVKMTQSLFIKTFSRKNKNKTIFQNKKMAKFLKMTFEKNNFYIGGDADDMFFNVKFSRSVPWHHFLFVTIFAWHAACD